MCVCVCFFPFSRAPVPHSLSQTSPPLLPLSSGLVSREEGREGEKLVWWVCGLGVRESERGIGLGWVGLGWLLL